MSPIPARATLYHYRTDEKTAGPVSKEVIDTLAAAGKLPFSTTMVRKEDSRNWVPLSAILQRRIKFQGAPAFKEGAAFHPHPVLRSGNPLFLLWHRDIFPDEPCRTGSNHPDSLHPRFHGQAFMLRPHACGKVRHYRCSRQGIRARRNVRHRVAPGPGRRAVG